MLFCKNRTYGHNLQKIVHSTVKLLLKSRVDTKDMFLVSKAGILYQKVRYFLENSVPGVVRYT